MSDTAEFEAPAVPSEDDTYGQTITIDGPVEVGEELPITGTDTVKEMPNDAADAPKRTKKRRVKKTDDGTEPARVRGTGGRVRSNATLERDERVITHLMTVLPNGERPKLTRAQLAEALELEPNLTYLCLYRLRLAGRVERLGAGANAQWQWIVDPNAEDGLVSETTQEVAEETTDSVESCTPEQTSDTASDADGVTENDTDAATAYLADDTNDVVTE